jgi:topoisomerase IV subunit B
MFVRKRPEMFFGLPQSDPGLPSMVLWWVLRDALSETPVTAPLCVDVVIHADRRFTVTDNGPGLPLEPVATGQEPAVTRMLTELMRGEPPPRGWSLAAATALCSEVTATVATNGQRWRQRATWSGPLGSLQDLGPTPDQGTRLDFSLDYEMFAQTAALPKPSETAVLAGELLDGAGLLGGEPGPAVGTEVRITDRRTGTHRVHVRGGSDDG